MIILKEIVMFLVEFYTLPESNYCRHGMVHLVFSVGLGQEYYRQRENKQTQRKTRKYQHGTQHEVREIENQINIQ